ncbi:hypothetical protein NGRA_3337, partial [Nosema granulosis]
MSEHTYSSKNDQDTSLGQVDFSLEITKSIDNQNIKPSDISIYTDHHYLVDNSNYKNQISNDDNPPDNSQNGAFSKNINTSVNSTNTAKQVTNTDDQFQPDDLTIDDNFDAFILDNFIPFSGKQNVIQWLNETEDNFNRLRIGRQLRFKTISLLVKDEAKRKYLTNRKEIQSFDDFYTFLLSQFDTSNNSICPCKPNKKTTNNSSNLPRSYHMKLADEPISNTSDSINLTRQTPVF